MLGAIAGDMCGSPWEGGGCRDKSFKLFAVGADITDDSVCTVAIADALLRNYRSPEKIAEMLRAWCKCYPGMGYGGLFNHWVYSPTHGKPYNSYGNGGAMRVAAAGWLATSLAEAEELAVLTAGITHNHPEGLRGATAIAGAIWSARQGMSPSILRPLLEQRYGYPLQRSISELADQSSYSTEAVDTVPIALSCALDATSWAESVRLAAYIGGDTDTIACMAGSVAEALYGIPLDISTTVLERIPADMRAVVEKFYAVVGRSSISKESAVMATAATPALSAPQVRSTLTEWGRWLLEAVTGKP